MEIIGFVGLGTIGGAVARNIQKAGYPMMVHDIRPEAVQPLVDLGARPAGSASEVGRHCRVVFSSLPGPREVKEVAFGGDGLLEGVHHGSVYVDLSSKQSGSHTAHPSRIPFARSAGHGCAADCR
ncbi:MAG TPA: NAD(P)-binding domain-containing protein [Candidatus Binatia bacterium]